jgi:glycosyltransferase involved in cell wall biosynthesis
MLRATYKVLRTIFGNHIVLDLHRHPLITRQYAGIVDRYAAANSDLDLLLATSVYYVDKHRTKIPIFAWGDTTEAGVIGSYPYYSNFSARMTEQSHRAEERALNACDQVIFSNQWAGDIALQHYKLPAERVHVITYGANILRSPSQIEIEEIVSKRDGRPCKAILVGGDWLRKGVNKAITVIGELRKKDINITLQVVGCNPPPDVQVPNYVEILGRISKDTQEGERRFHEVLQSAHVFLLPTIAECAAVSLAEANAYGLPVVVSDVGGNGSLVKEGINGHLCAVDAPSSVWVEALERVIGDPATYRDQCLRAHAFYESELSWNVAVRRFGELVQSELQRSGGRA